VYYLKVKLRFIKKQSEVPGVYSFIFEPARPVRWQAGQYLHYDLPHPEPDDRGTERWFTISAAPFEKHIRLTTRFDGERRSSFKQALLKLKPGSQVTAGEPRGSFTLEPTASRHILIGGGIGVTPYRSMLVQLDHDDQPLNVDLLYANRDENFVFDGEFAGLAKKHPEFKIRKFVGDQRITGGDLKEYLKDDATIFYISGPRPMVENYQHLLNDLGVNEPHLKSDYFPGY